MFRAARFKPEEPPPAGAVDLAIALYGGDVFRVCPSLRTEADVAMIRGSPRIILRGGTDSAKAHFLIAEQAARLWVGEAPWFTVLPGPMRAGMLRTVAAWLVAPPPAVQTLLAASDGPDIEAVAHRFHISETCATRRISECEGPASIVTTPTHVHRSGAWWLHRVADDDVRRLAANEAPRGIRRFVLHDEPGRVALLARPA